VAANPRSGLSVTKIKKAQKVQMARGNLPLTRFRPEQSSGGMS